MAEIVAVGEILVEMVATGVGQDLARSGAFEGPFPSGAPAIFADQAALQGAGVAMIGCVGEDPFGDAVVNRLRGDGVDTRWVRHVGDVATGVAFVAYRADGGRRFVFHMANAAAGRLRPEDVAAAAFEGCRLLHVMGSSLFSPEMGEAVRRAARLAREAGALVSYDPNVRPELLALPGTAALLGELLGEADILMPSEADLAHFYPDQNPDAAAAALLAQGARCVFLKRGRAGSTCYDRDGRVDVPAFPAVEVDPTGAGDCAGATFAAALLRGASGAEAALRANAAGALAVSRRGPMEGNSRPGDLDQLIAERSHP